MDFSTLNKKQMSMAFGVTYKTVDDWVAKGCPKKKEGTKYSFNLPDVIKWRDDMRSGATAGVRKIDKDILIHKLDKEKEDARLKHEQANKVEMENAVRRGELVLMDEIEAWWCNQLVNMKNRIMAIPAKVTPQIIGETDKDIINHKIKGMCIEALDELSADFRNEGETVTKEDT